MQVVEKRLAAQHFTVAVVGCGRIGLPHALVSAEAGNTVFAIDTNPSVIQSLKGSQAHFTEEGAPSLLRSAMEENRFVPSSDFSLVRGAQVIVLCIGVGFSNEGEIDLSPLLNAIAAIAPYLRDGKLLILRTTMPVGTCDSIRKQIEILTGLEAGRDFFIAFVPERLVEGKAIREEKELPKIIGAYDEEGFELARSYFETIGGEIVRVSSPRAAEILKLADNSWRQMRFAFSNDLSLLCDSVGEDVLEVIRAANHGYARNGIPDPSCGVSGYCLSKDPKILELSFKGVSERRGFPSVWQSARMTNDWMVEDTYDKVVSLLGEHGKQGRVLIAGLTFKEDCDDFRLSHGIELARRLSERFDVTLYDPFLSGNNNNPYLSVPLKKVKVSDRQRLVDSLDGHDAVIFTVRHREFVDMAADGGVREMVERMTKPAIIVDGWNIFEKAAGIEESTLSRSLVYYGVGRRRAA